MSAHFMSSPLLWLLSYLRQERSALALTQLLESPAVQVEQGLQSLAEAGFAAQDRETQQWSLTPQGQEKALSLSLSLIG